MTRIKEASTIQENKKLVFQECPITYVMERIGGYWKPIVLFNLLSGAKRYGEIRRAMPQITEKVLIQQLKQLEADGLLLREAKPVIPPHVVYRLSESGKALQPVLYAMAVWAVAESEQNSPLARKDLSQFPAIE
ncbi:winged helix-turn-helix transcriptional regulator [Hymenobacter negativus]|uniref:Helix-turn-helix transcriptional regulator n=1 Tax=Hymenobacter negativus TaxID=2795026 RepID=A0ABS3QLP3_9BACT|nr:helix-turn-helix domain-containing protein [Hymenobacter negativus]MBO2012161.1 helix-turn-helix transcriptional regulator [Hymenobacter negativus]